MEPIPNNILGLIAGKGELPQLVAETASRKGLKVAVACFDDAVYKSLQSMVYKIALLGIGQAGKTIKYLRDSGVVRVVLIGKFEKKLVFRDLLFDAAGLRIMSRAVRKSDTSVILSIFEELEAGGLVIEKQTDWLPDLLPGKGTIGTVQPSERVLDDISYGAEICRDLAGKDIGQTIIVKEGVVVAVEGVEGTDETIERGCRLAGNGVVMVKMSRPKQDMRYDIPTIGLETINRLADMKAAGLAFEAGRVVIVNKDEVIKRANAAGISLVAV